MARSITIAVRGITNPEAIVLELRIRIHSLVPFVRVVLTMIVEAVTFKRVPVVVVPPARILKLVSSAKTGEPFTIVAWVPISLALLAAELH